jgi:hypothetical protein
MPDVQVWEPYAGSDDPVVRRQWRKNRQAAYRLGYKDRKGKQHPASKRKPEKAAEKMLLEATEPPKGMDWNDFGVLWDLDPEHPFLPRLRTKGSVEEQWDKHAAENLPELPAE